LAQEALLETAYQNEWYRWAQYTVKQATDQSCVLCALSPLKKLRIVPSEFDYRHCARFNANYCDRRGHIIPYCPADCLSMLGNADYKWHFNQYGWGDTCKKLDIKVAVEKREIPDNYLVDRSLEYECFSSTSGSNNVGHFRGKCVIIWHLDFEKFYEERPNLYKSTHSTYATATVQNNMTIIQKEQNCESATLSFPLIAPLLNQTEVIADYYGLCGGRKLRTTLIDWKGLCVRVRLAQHVGIVNWNPNDQPLEKDWSKPNQRMKRAYTKDASVYLDAIGQPRGIPHEYKARSEVLSGWESLLLWVPVNKNTEWINYIYYNQQRFINYTDEALQALGEQLKATSKMTWQNRQALNWLLADTGGVCVMFETDCCTFIPNNTAPDGSFTTAIKKIKSLRDEVTKNAGRDRNFGYWLDSIFSSWKDWLIRIGLILAISVGVFFLLFCCVVPFLRSMLASAAAKQMINVSVSPSGIDVEGVNEILPSAPDLDEWEELL